MASTNLIGLSGKVYNHQVFKTKNGKFMSSFSLCAFNGKDKRPFFINVKFLAEDDYIAQLLTESQENKNGVIISGKLREEEFYSKRDQQDVRRLFIWADKVDILENQNSNVESKPDIKNTNKPTYQKNASVTPTANTKITAKIVSNKPVYTGTITKSQVQEPVNPESKFDESEMPF